MACCKCEQYKWPDPQEVVWTDEKDGKGYCVFHAPVEHKGVNTEKFMEKVYARIDGVKVLNDLDVICHLEGAEFPSGASFKKYGPDNPLPSIDFYGTSFNDGAEFSEVTFSNVAEFTGVRFGAGSTFSGSTFLDEAFFSRSKFGGGLFFSGATFKNNTTFLEIEFEGDVDFYKASFGNNTTLNGITFHGYSNFEGTNFGENLEFYEITFEDEANFDKSIFLNKCELDSVLFMKSASFRNTIFKGNTLFKDLKFQGISSLFNTNFIGYTKFLRCSFYTSATLQNLHVQEHLALLNMDLSNTYFHQTPLNNISFQNITWPKSSDGTRYNLTAEDNLEQIELQTGESPFDGASRYAAIADFYRQMKKRNMDEQNQSEASLWHSAEKEMQLKLHRLEGRWSFQYLMLWLYRFISRYGEDPKRAFKVFLVLLLALAFFIGLGALNIPGYSMASINPDRAGKFLLTFTQYALLTSPTYTLPTGWAAAALFLSRLLIPIQAAIFGFALRNKLRR